MVLSATGSVVFLASGTLLAEGADLASAGWLAVAVALDSAVGGGVTYVADDAAEAERSHCRNDQSGPSEPLGLLWLLLNWDRAIGRLRPTRWHSLLRPRLRLGPLGCLRGWPWGIGGWDADDCHKLGKHRPDWRKSGSMRRDRRIVAGL